jgi:hypothetical protein
MLKCDHTFEVCKSIRGVEFDQTFEAYFTVMNEFCQIVGQYAVQTKSQAELAPKLQAMARRFALDGMKVMCSGYLCMHCKGMCVQHGICFVQGPTYIYVDDPNLAGDLLSIFHVSLHPPLLVDICHVMRRYNDTLTSHHPLRGTPKLVCDLSGDET